MLKEIYSSDARSLLGETLDEVYDNKLPIVVKKRIAGGSKDFIFISKKVFEDLINDISFVVNIFNENDGSITLELPELNLIVNSTSLEEASIELANDIILYTNEYIENIHLYSISPNKKDQLKYIIKVSNFNDVESIINFFKYVH